MKCHHCPQCGKNFSGSTAYYSHMANNGEKWYYISGEKIPITFKFDGRVIYKGTFIKLGKFLGVLK